MRRTLTLLGVIAIAATVIRAQASEPDDPGRHVTKADPRVRRPRGS